MSKGNRSLVTENVWRTLRRYTDARIGLGRAGISLPTSELLAFQLAHAQARDAVHQPLDTARLIEDLERVTQASALGQPVLVHSQAADRFTYLQRPDLGRRLSESSREHLTARGSAEDYDLAVVIVDGLSSSAVQTNAPPLLSCVLNDLDQSSRSWRLAPLTVVGQGRVAIGDEIGAMLKARMVAVLIGERPGLSSPDSLGVYLTFGPKSGLNDARRNCISNIRPAGLTVHEASQRLLYLMREADRLGVSGVALKDRTEEVKIDARGASQNFLTK